MRFKLSKTSVLKDGDNFLDVYERIKFGIFSFLNQEIKGGWIDFPLPIELEFEAMGWIVHKMGSNSEYRVFFSTEQEFSQIIFIISDYISEFEGNLPKNKNPFFERTPYYDKLEKQFERANQEIHSWKKFLEQIRNMDQIDIELYNRFNSIFSNFEDIEKNLKVPDDQSIPESLRKKYQSKANELEEIRETQKFDTIVESLIKKRWNNLKKNLENFSHLLPKNEKDNFKDDITLKLEILASIFEKYVVKKQNYKELLAEMNFFKETIQQDITLIKECRLYGDFIDSYDTLLYEIGEAIQNLEKLIEDIDDNLNNYLGELKSYLKLFKIIEKITPGRHTSLFRLAELFESEEKTNLEEKIKRCVEDHPWLGEYDDYSQDFIFDNKINNIEFSEYIEKFEGIIHNNDSNFSKP